MGRHTTADRSRSEGPLPTRALPPAFRQQPGLDRRGTSAPASCRTSAHRVDEDHPRPRPLQRLLQALWPELERKPLLVGVPRDAAPALGERLGVTVRATRRHLVATRHRVPGRLSPLGRAVVGQGGYSFGFVGILSRWVTEYALLVCGDRWGRRLTTDSALGGLAELDRKVVRLKLLSNPYIGLRLSGKLSNRANT